MKYLFALCLFYIAQSQQLTAQTVISEQKNAPTKAFSWPMQLEMHVSYEPTAFPSGLNSHLIYELYLTNFGSSPINLRRIEVVDADIKNAEPIATFEADQIKTMLQPIGRTITDSEEKLSLAGGQSVIVFMEIVKDRKVPLPNRIKHRMITEQDTLTGAAIATQHTNLQLFGAPLEGTNWLAADGPGNSENNHHRRGVIVLNGRAVDSRRYAIDWKKVKDGLSFSGDSRDTHSYFCYNEKVFAVADGRIIRAKDGLPDNIPGHGDAFHPAVPITFETVAGNSVTIDLGNGHFAYYMHLQPGTLQVKIGDHVRKGQLLARIGASGDAREPHLHFEVTTSPTLLLGEGVPYVIEHYRLNSEKNGSTTIHINELPLDNETVDF
jgi:hypothetical protein